MFDDGPQPLFAAAKIIQFLNQGFFRTVFINRRQFIPASIEPDLK